MDTFEPPLRCPFVLHPMCALYLFPYWVALLRLRRSMHCSKSSLNFQYLGLQYLSQRLVYNTLSTANTSTYNATVTANIGGRDKLRKGIEGFEKTP
jgi:hypothetical protein